MNAITYYSEAIKKVDEGEITIGEYERMINVLRDVEPVVRCRDCKHWRHNITCGAVILSGKLWNYCHKHNEMMTEDDFCSRGERKDGDNG